MYSILDSAKKYLKLTLNWNFLNLLVTKLAIAQQSVGQQQAARQQAVGQMKRPIAIRQERLQLFKENKQLIR